MKNFNSTNHSVGTQILIDIPNIGSAVSGFARFCCPLSSFINFQWLRGAVASRFGRIHSARAYLSPAAHELPVARRTSRCLCDSGFDVRVVSQADPCFDKKDPVDSAIRADIYNSIRPGSASTLVLASCDGGYAPWLSCALAAGVKVVVLGFLELFPEALLKLRNQGATLLDLEHDLRASWRPLPNRQAAETLTHLGLLATLPIVTRPAGYGVGALFAAAGV